MRFQTTMSALVLSLSLLALGCDDEPDTSGGGTGGSGTGGMGGATGGPRGADDPPTLGDQIDRMGRPAINIALNNTFNPDQATKATAKNAYNEAPPSEWIGFADAFAESMAIWDSLDGICGNQILAGEDGQRYLLLSTVLTDDQLYVNSSRSECGFYLGVEAEAIAVVEEGVGACGGRTPEDDVIETTLSLLISGELEGIDDGVEGNDLEFSNSFPFLPPPHE